MFRRNLRYRMFPKRRWIAVPEGWGYLLDIAKTTEGDGFESLEHIHLRNMDVIHVAASLIHFTPEEIRCFAGQVEMVLLPQEYLEFNVLDPRYPEWPEDDGLVDYYIGDICRAWHQRGHRKHYRYAWWPKIGYENKVLKPRRKHGLHRNSARGGAGESAE